MNNITITEKQINYLEDVVYNGLQPAGIAIGGGGGDTSGLYYSKVQLDGGQLDNRYYTETEIGTLFYTKTQLNAGQLNNLYYTETELNNGQLDNRYYTETEINTWRAEVTQTEMGYLHGVASDVQTQITARVIIGADAANDRLATWTGATTIKGEPNLTFDDIVLTNKKAYYRQYSTEAGKEDWRFTLYNANANLAQIYNYDEGETAYRNMVLGNGTDFLYLDLANTRIGVNRNDPAYTFDINGTGRFVNNLYGDANVQHKDFTTGFQGTNWQITDAGNGELNNLLVRGGLTVYELILNRLHYQCGGLIIGAGGGKIKTIHVATQGSEQLEFEDPAGNSILPFTVGAIVMIQDFDLNRTTVVKKIVRQIASILGQVLTLTTTAGWLIGDDVGAFAYGDEILAIGHVSNTALDASIYFSATDSDNPFCRVFDGVDSYAKWSLGDKTTIKVQWGNLASLANYDIIDATPGYGFYCPGNLYLGKTGNSMVWDGTDLAIQGTIRTSMAGGNEGIKIYMNQIWENEYNNDLGVIYINYHGYDAGITKFRSTIIGDGKNAPLAEFNGYENKVKNYAKTEFHKGIVPINKIHGANVTLNTIFNALAPTIPNINDEMMLNGSYEHNGVNMIFSYAKRTGTTTINTYYVSTSGYASVLVITDGSAETLDAISIA